MTDEHAYESLLDKVNAVEQGDVKALNMPADVFIHEALRLREWAGEDRAELETGGLAWETVEDLSVRAAALRHAQGLWVSERFQNEEAQKIWAESSPEAYDLRNSLLHTYRFAFRKRPDLLRVVDMIAEGSGHVDMIQDLADLAVAGRRSMALLEAVGMDLALLDRCESLSGELGKIYAEARNDRASYRQAKRVRDIIATLLKESVDEIREYGQYVFWRNDQRRKGYISEYHQQANRSFASSAETPDESQDETVTA